MSDPAFCGVCGRAVAAGEFLLHDGMAICGECKDGYFQRLREMGREIGQPLPSYQARLMILLFNTTWAGALIFLPGGYLADHYLKLKGRADGAFGLAMGIAVVLLALAVSGRWQRLRWRSWPRAYALVALGWLLAAILTILVILPIVSAYDKKSHPSLVGMLDKIGAFAVFVVLMALLTLAFLWVFLFAAKLKPSRGGDQD